MPDQHQLVGILCGSGCDEMARAGFDGGIEPGRLAATEASQGCPAAHDLAHETAMRERLGGKRGGPAPPPAPATIGSHSGCPKLLTTKVAASPIPAASISQVTSSA